MINLSWKPIAVVAVIVGISFLVYTYANSVRQEERTKIELQLLEEQNDKIERAKKSVSTPSSSSADVDNDASNVMRDWKSRQAGRE